jgi:NAD-dependent dihydropyrimidine dehydrogenase PreA subunit
VTYVIAEPCRGSKDASCVEVCPVDCIHPTPDEPGFESAEQLFVNPEECIDCNSCVSECPVEAILPDSELPERWHGYLAENAAYFRD